MTSVIAGPEPAIPDATLGIERSDQFAAVGRPRTFESVRPYLAWVGLAIGMPLVGFLVVRPDWFYGLNGIDSFFYTGYAQNLGDNIAVSRDLHYFVTRWSAYLPNRVFFDIFGAETGYLMLRWLYASVICGAIIALGHRRWRRADTIAMVSLVLLMPMLLRTLLSDYVDSLTVPAGIACIAVVALWPRSRWTATVAGALAAAIVVANPIAIAIVLCLIPVWVRELGWSKKLATSAAIGGATLCGVLVAGWLLFRVRYGISNVYTPTIDFVRTNTALIDPQKSPRLWWMGYRIWIYIPIVVLLVWQYLKRISKVTFDPAERIIMATCAVQYGFQIWYQFSRHGSTLEIPYYWSTMVPVLILSVCVVLGKLIVGSHRFLLSAVAAVVLVAVLVGRRGMPELYGSWVDAALVVVIIGALWWKRGPFLGALGACSLVFVIFTFQVSAPRPEPLLPGEGQVAAAYESVYDADQSSGIDSYRAATWFSSTMRSLGDPLTQSAFFWIGGGHAHQMAAMFSAHVDNRWLNPGWGANSLGDGLTKDFTWAIGQAKIVNTIVMLGTTDDLNSMTATLTGLRPGYDVRFDGVAPDELHTRVRVVTYPAG